MSKLARRWNVVRIALRVAAGALLASVTGQATLAQQHWAMQRGNIVQAPKLKIAPAKDRPAMPPGPNIVERNAIGLPLARPATGQKQAAPIFGPAELHAYPAPAPVAGPARSGLQPGSMPVPMPRPLVLSRGTINGAGFTRPGTALTPLGGPAKSAATAINGTSFRPKH
jgi:hypothetical protein